MANNRETTRWDCECAVRESEMPLSGAQIRWIEHCPLHAQAPAMLESLKQIAIWGENGQTADSPQSRAAQRNNAERLRLIASEARAILRAVDGEK